MKLEQAKLEDHRPYSDALATLAALRQKHAELTQQCDGVRALHSAAVVEAATARKRKLQGEPVDPDALESSVQSRLARCTAADKDRAACDELLAEQEVIVARTLVAAERALVQSVADELRGKRDAVTSASQALAAAELAEQQYRGGAARADHRRALGVQSRRAARGLRARGLGIA
jgi:hypothetical protein